MLLAVSHAVIASDDVTLITKFFETAFQVKPYFANAEFSEFVLPNKFRIAFFKPTGLAGKTFSTTGNRGAMGFGVTVKDIEASYEHMRKLTSFTFSLSGPPKEHPWGEKSFLLTDPQGNRWEITQSPSTDGMLINR